MPYLYDERPVFLDTSEDTSTYITSHYTKPINISSKTTKLSRRRLKKNCVKNRQVSSVVPFVPKSSEEVTINSKPSVFDYCKSMLDRYLSVFENWCHNIRSFVQSYCEDYVSSILIFFRVYQPMIEIDKVQSPAEKIVKVSKSPSNPDDDESGYEQSCKTDVEDLEDTRNIVKGLEISSVLTQDLKSVDVKSNFKLSTFVYYLSMLHPYVDVFLNCCQSVLIVFTKDFFEHVAYILVLFNDHFFGKEICDVESEGEGSKDHKNSDLFVKKSKVINDRDDEESGYERSCKTVEDSEDSSNTGDEFCDQEQPKTVQVIEETSFTEGRNIFKCILNFWRQKIVSDIADKSGNEMELLKEETTIEEEIHEVDDESVSSDVLDSESLTLEDISDDQEQTKTIQDVEEINNKPNLSHEGTFFFKSLLNFWRKKSEVGEKSEGTLEEESTSGEKNRKADDERVSCDSVLKSSLDGWIKDTCDVDDEEEEIVQVLEDDDEAVGKTGDTSIVSPSRDSLFHTIFGIIYGSRVSGNEEAKQKRKEEKEEIKEKASEDEEERKNRKEKRLAVKEDNKNESKEVYKIKSCNEDLPRVDGVTDCDNCKKVMSESIWSCQGCNWNLCEDCNMSHEYCINCTTWRARVRNYTHERIVKHLVAGFKNSRRNCNFGLMKCPIANDIRSSCEWLGTITDVRSHLQESHCLNDSDKEVFSVDVTVTSKNVKSTFEKYAIVANYLWYMRVEHQSKKIVVKACSRGPVAPLKKKELEVPFHVWTRVTSGSNSKQRFIGSDEKCVSNMTFLTSIDCSELLKKTKSDKNGTAIQLDHSLEINVVILAGIL